MKKEPYKVTYKVPEGEYHSNSISGLIWEIFKHRLSHLIFDGKWSD